MTNQAENTAQAGIRVYSGFTLKFYDLLILGVSNRLAWRCPSPSILEFYNRNVSANHLDVGVGTGYFLDKCRFPADHPQISLMDLNPTSLKVTAKRLDRYRPATYVANILEQFQMSLPKFDSIGLSYLIHCLPGSMSEKSAIFKHLKTLLNPGGTLFGTTILGKGTQHNLFAKALIAFYNKLGVFGNANDTLTDLEQALRENFSTYSVTIVGCVAFFTAKV
jgi:ubiquinone/menaquinone biosynthesis C-methylase UbiE